MTAEVNKLFSAVEGAKNILLVAHANPDGDTLGSSLAFAHYLENLKKPYSHYCNTAAAGYFDYLPKINQINNLITGQQLELYDLIIFFDHGALSQSNIEELISPLILRHDIIIANIDHHQSNSHFGNINIVNLEASSTCETIYQIFKHKNISIDRNMATCLMTGIITDTGNFTNSATKQSSLEAASDLSRLGAKIPEISAHVLQNKTIPSLNLWGTVLNRLVIDEKEGMAFTVITQNDFEENGIEREAIDGLINFLACLENVRYVKLLVEEKDGRIKGSLRTVRNDVDVAEMAAKWGGGGHKKAAGFHMEGKLREKDGKWEVISK